MMERPQLEHASAFLVGLFSAVSTADAADGATTPFWEMNVRPKLDTRATGPTPGRSVVAGAGMQGDRVAVIFSSVEEIKRFVAEKCSIDPRNL